ncbi:hypothetical protein NFI96_007733 [Prochilodus magdalenae]|nr:hypothetical protein NFI96_007733 [Prochilodus magdalenae]
MLTYATSRSAGSAVCGGMDEEEQNRYVAQLKEEFDSCDTTGTGFLDKEELTVLCHKLSLDAHLPLLLDTLLGPQHYARVNFEEFKEGFVAVLSRSLDFSTSEEDSSYLEPAVPEEVKPKFVKGTKRYGRRSQPDKTASVLTADLEDSLPFGTEQEEALATGVRSAKLRRSTSLESVEGTAGQLKRWKADSSGNPTNSTAPCQEVTDGQVKAVWEELGVGNGGSLNRQELALVCDHIGLKDLQSEEIDALFRKLDKDQDGKVSLSEFQKGLFRHGTFPVPTAASTPIRSNTQRAFPQALEERVVRSTSPSLLSATVGQRLLTRLDDGSGCTSPDRVIALWTEEGIRNSRDILQTLDFPFEDRLSLAELTLALDNELLVSGNGIHQAALISYKDEIQFLQVLANQACQERDKAKADLELADRRNLQLVREIDDRHATMESLNESKIKDLEQDFRDKLTAIRSEAEQENEVLLQQVEKEGAKLKEEVEVLKAQEATLQEEAATAIKENCRLEEEMCALKEKLSESESTISKLKKDLDHVLQDKYGLDPNSTGLLSQEEHLSGIIKEYERQCRWKGTDDPETKRGTSPQVKKGKNVLGSLERLTPTVSIETELAMEQLKESYEQQVQDLKIQLETKFNNDASRVNFYERTIELMKQNMEVERKEIAQSYKMEISELEEQKTQAEGRLEQLRQTVERLDGELKVKGESVAWGPEQERRVQREQAELEQNYAREISNIVHRLTSEKDQLEAELKLKMDQNVLFVREEMEQQLTRMKLESSEAQHSLQQQLQEQTEQHCREMGTWEARVQELEQELRKERLLSAERLGEEQAQICSSAAQERKKLEEKHQEERQLEEKLEEMCVQLEDNTISMKAQDALIQNLTSELHAKEREMDVKKEREQKLLSKMEKTKEELLSKLSQLEERHQQTQLEEQEKELERYRDNLEKTHEALKNRDEDLSRQASELESVERHRDRLMEELSSQGIVLKNLQDQLSSQIVEMEAESTKLKEDLEELRGELKHRHTEVLELGRQLEAKAKEMDMLWNEVRQKMDLFQNVSHLSSEVELLTSLLDDKEKELCSLREVADNSTNQLQQSLMDSQAEVCRVEEAFEKEKSQMRAQLLEMEKLVIALETVMDPASPHRFVALGLNSNCREEVLELSTRNLQLSNENAELNSRLRSDQGAVQMLTEKLTQVSQEQEDAAVSIKQLQETSSQLEREKLQLEVSKQKEKEQLERELKAAKDKLHHLTDVESAVTSLTLKNESLQKHNDGLSREVEERNKKLETLQQRVDMLENQTAQLHSQLYSMTNEKDAHIQEMSEHQKLLRESQEKVLELEASMQELHKEKEQLQEIHKMQEEATASSVQEELRTIRVHNQELLDKVAVSESKLQMQELDLQRVKHECLTLKNKQAELETAKHRAEEQALRANTDLSLSQAQHVREVQQLREQASIGTREHLAHLQAQLAEQQSRTQQLGEQLRSQAQQASTQLSLQQEQYEKVMENMQERMEEVEAKLKNVRLMLQEKVNQLKEQLAKNAKSDLLLKDLYVENSQLMKALQVTEQRQKSAEKKSFLLEEKVAALNKLLRKIAPASLSV